MRLILLTGCLLACLAAAGCGGDDEPDQAKDCLKSTAALEAAAKRHANVIVVGTKALDSEAGSIDVEACRTSDDDATATVTVRDIPDDSIRDQRHELTLERKNARWVVVRDLDTQRCREGRGHEDFSSLVCK
ncbi:MAG TPA: hypothetical protein VMY78_15515 [Solirubrobacteraceae bacterium]|nr:hypothetical protein [Solirubrobacteraceae bacterium]